MKISARNILKGEIIEIVKGGTTSHVKIDIGGAVVTSSITNEAVDDLRLAPGKTAYGRRQGIRRHDWGRLGVRWCAYP
jgi:molybdopterin-binding protein